MKPLIASVNGAARPLPLRVVTAMSAVRGHPPLTAPTSFVRCCYAAWYASTEFTLKIASARPACNATLFTA
ncbi:hypothetical protein NCW_05084 [Burkholderia pseudomallei]